MTVTLFRVEHPESLRGPYTHTTSNETILSMQSLHNSMAGYDDDPWPGWSHYMDTDWWSTATKWVGGFAKEEHIEAWFGDFLPDLWDEGFTIRRYRRADGSVIHMGPNENRPKANHQVAFRIGQLHKKAVLW